MSFMKYIPKSLDIDEKADVITIDAVTIDEMSAKVKMTYTSETKDVLIAELRDQQKFGVVFRDGQVSVVDAVGRVADRDSVTLSLDDQDVLLHLPEETSIDHDAVVSCKGLVGLRSNASGFLLSGTLTTPAPDASMDAGM